MNLRTETSHHNISQDDDEQFGKNMWLAFGKTPKEAWLDSDTELTFTEWKKQNDC
jgi:hypothetical protein